MGDKLTNEDKTFVKEIVQHGNQTEAAKKAYGYEDSNVAGVMANKKLRKVKIQKAIKTLADRIPEDTLHKVLVEGLEASTKKPHLIDRDDKGRPIYDYIPEDDFSTRHKYLDTAIKLKGLYAPDKSVNVNIDIDTASPEARALAEEYENKLKGKL